MGNKPALVRFLQKALPATLQRSSNPLLRHIETKDQFIEDVLEGVNKASMNIRLTPQILSAIDWARPLDDPIRLQFIPLSAGLLPDHPKLTLDSLHEEADSRKRMRKFFFLVADVHLQLFLALCIDIPTKLFS